MKKQISHYAHGEFYKMLILTRKVSESLKIGDNVTVTVLGISGGQVRIGVDAPKEISVHREEIYNRIQDEKRGKKNETVRPPTKDSQQDFEKQITLQQQRPRSGKNNSTLSCLRKPTRT